MSTPRDAMIEARRAFDEAIPTTQSGDYQNTVFRAERYAPDHPAFDGRDLTPGDPIEN